MSSVEYRVFHMKKNEIYRRSMYLLKLHDTLTVLERDVKMVRDRLESAQVRTCFTVVPNKARIYTSMAAFVVAAGDLDNRLV